MQSALSLYSTNLSFWPCHLCSRGRSDDLPAAGADGKLPVEAASETGELFKKLPAGPASEAGKLPGRPVPALNLGALEGKQGVEGSAPLGPPSSGRGAGSSRGVTVPTDALMAQLTCPISQVRRVIGVGVWV